MAVNNYQDLLKKVEKVTAQKGLDLSSGEDLSIGIMNLIAIEEHLFYSSQKTKDNKYLELLNEVRLMRTGLMKEIVKNPEGEIWCISKHLLAASMRLMEVGTKELKKDNKTKSRDLFDKAYKLYTLFWGLNLGAVKVKDVKQETKEDKTVFAKLGTIINKVLDCCRE